jgi:hypothetical protein
MFSSINLLLEAREKDTYRKAGPRWLYEGIIGEEAPTISRSVLNRLKLQITEIGRETDS